MENNYFLYSNLQNEINNYNNLSNNNLNNNNLNLIKEISRNFQENGYIILKLNNLTNKQNEYLNNYENIFQNIFLLNDDIKKNIFQYNTIKGYTLGYRKDGLREFIETRIENNYNIILPYINNNEYNELIIEIWKILKEITKYILISMSIAIGIDPLYFLNLIDPDIIPENEISSSILRICSYPFDSNYSKESQISFGAHTDTTFITIGTFSSTPGLEIQHNTTKEWILVEDIPTNNENDANEPDFPKVVIFVGDVMQLLTNGFYKATVHRVRTYHRHPTKHIQVPRVSCPFLVRGRHKSKIPSIYKCKRYPSFSPPPSLSSSSLSSLSVDLPPPPPLHLQSSSIPLDTLISSSDETLNQENTLEVDNNLKSNETFVELADFEGMNMKLIHSILDLKRQKCMKENQKNQIEGDEYQSDEEKAWVLKAFP